MEHKKQAFNTIESICKLNNDQWNNKAGSHDFKIEASYQIEEAIECFNPTALSIMLQDGIGIEEVSHKGIARALVKHTPLLKDLEEVDAFDKSIDAIYFAIGAMHKLGLSPQQIVDGIQVVHEANLAKSGKKDSNGKVIKTNDFLAPEPRLQKILDARV